jgi:hypothetical protein
MSIVTRGGVSVCVYIHVCGYHATMVCVQPRHGVGLSKHELHCFRPQDESVLGGSEEEGEKKHAQHGRQVDRGEIMAAGKSMAACRPDSAVCGCAQHVVWHAS